MTTIIIVVVVALVFFVALCVVTFMVWKREEEMRTDSLRSIETNLQELGYRMTGDFSRRHSRRKLAYDDGYDSVPYREARGSSVDPFEWTRETGPGSDRPSVSVMQQMEEPDELSGPGRQIEQTELRAYEDVYAGEGTNISEEIDGSGTGTAVAAHVDAERAEGEHAEAAQAAPAEHGAEPEAEMSAEHESGHEEDAASEAVSPGDEIVREEFVIEDKSEDELEGTLDIEELEALDDLESFEAYAEDLDVEAIDDYEPLDEKPAQEEPADLYGLLGTDGYVTDFSPEGMAPPREPIGHDVGRSGRKYTAEELDMLIRE